MSFATKLRRGEGPVWGTLKAATRAALTVHVPVNAVTRPLFGLLYKVHVAARESWTWARRFFWNEPLFRSQCEAVGPGLRMEELPYVGGRGRITRGGGVRRAGRMGIAFNTRGDRPPEFVLGDNTFVGHMCSFSVARSIRVGRNCYLAAGAAVLDQDGHPLDAAARRAGLPTPPDAIAPVAIGDDVWVGAGALILKGVTVGDRAVVAARSVVTKDVPADAVVAGNPARVVKQLGPDGGDGVTPA
jgi:acetyltransferase-like isoleucine patch superfamily enzyme